jgi:hypothetical protein
MCEVNAMIAISSLLSYGAQASNANQQESSQNKLFEANKVIADEAATSGYGSLATKNLQEQEAAGQKIGEATRKARLATGEASARAGALGASGGSLDALFSDYERQRVGYESAVLRQTEVDRLSYVEQAKGIQSNQASNILSAQPGYVAKPNILQFGADAYTDILLNEAAALK